VALVGLMVSTILMSAVVLDVAMKIPDVTGMYFFLAEAFSAGKYGPTSLISITASCCFLKHDCVGGIRFNRPENDQRHVPTDAGGKH